MSKEKILDEYRKKFGLCDGSLKYCGCKKELDFISKAIDQTREEAIREVEEMIKKEFPHQKLYCEAQDLEMEILEEINKLKK